MLMDLMEAFDSMVISFNDPVTSDTVEVTLLADLDIGTLIDFESAED
jgi:hypothetical protein